MSYLDPHTLLTDDLGKGREARKITALFHIPSPHRMETTASASMNTWMTYSR